VCASMWCCKGAKGLGVRVNFTSGKADSTCYLLIVFASEHGQAAVKWKVAESAEVYVSMEEC
jgi:hypothetical protein